ncbi:peptide ABC transporter substrate-binding protein [Aliidongia dinghuensis]|uniref:Peptide ABC transporter substrate-binding protein n=1 Tax=Aliidongia dinghuensis TaxID=1867774 RepID=A0A8J2YQB8_9PROT|nr:peptide ABC transporter substrate-binding protein [Aliidongia dinghuensis]GGF07833.1 peptide ABC transporter substrate-binding protein [Aliidongia dinghuensis]
MVPRGFLLLLTILALLTIPARADQVLRLGNGSEPATLDPALCDLEPDLQILHDLFEGLVVIGPKGEALPGEAERWTVSPDGMTYRFTLRPGLTWSNGAPLTAEDFAWSWRRAVDPGTGSKYAFPFYPILNAQEIVTGRADPQSLGVRALDDRTLEVRLKAPTGFFLKLIGMPAFSPAYRPAVEKFGRQYSRPGNLVSNGAFELAEWTPQSRIVLRRSSRYWDAGAVTLDRVEYLPIENQNEELKRYRAGELDMTYDVPSDQIDLIRAELAPDLHILPYLGTYYLGFNLTRPPFKDNLKLREAINLAIDREAIVGKITRTGETASYGWVPPGLDGYENQSFPWKDEPMAARIARARQLYAEAGYGPDRPLEIELRYNTNENHKKIMIAVAAMLKQALGIRVSLVNQEFKVFVEARKEKRETQLFRDGWTADYPDPNNFAELLLSSAGLNDPGYANPEYDDLVHQAQGTVDAPERMKLLEAAERLVLRDQPLVPIYSYSIKRLIKPYVHGLEINILNFYYSKPVRLDPH